MLLEVEKAFEKEKKEYGEKQRELGILAGTKKGIKEANIITASEMVKNDYDNETILRLIKDLSETDLEQLRKEINNN